MQDLDHLIESIISLNDNVFDLGESEGLPRSFNKWIQNNNEYSLLDLYEKEISNTKFQTNMLPIRIYLITLIFH